MGNRQHEARRNRNDTGGRAMPSGIHDARVSGADLNGTRKVVRVE